MLLTETLAYLRERDSALVFADGRVAKHTLVAAATNYLLEEALVETDDDAEVARKARTAPEVRLAILGEGSDPAVVNELDVYVGGLLGVGRKDDVQKALNGDGSPYLLCPTRVTRPVLPSGTTTRGARFVSAHPMLTERYLMAYRGKRALAAAGAYVDTFDLAVSRQPELEARRAELLGELGQQIRLELGPGNSSWSGS